MDPLALEPSADTCRLVRGWSSGSVQRPLSRTPPPAGPGHPVQDAGQPGSWVPAQQAASKWFVICIQGSGRCIRPAIWV